MDPYKILELDHNSSIDDVKKKYKKLAFKYHPDKQNEKNDEKFKELKNAYDLILSKDNNIKTPGQLLDVLFENFSSWFQITQAILNGIKETPNGIQILLPSGQNIFVT